MGYSYGYGYSDFEWDVFWHVMAGALLFSLVIGLVFYIFESLGLYAIAKRRGIKRAWLAWVPVGNVWLLGKISDQYQQYAHGKKTYRAAILLWCNLAMVVLSIPLLVMAVRIMVNVVETAHYVRGYIPSMSMLGSVGLLSLAVMALSIVIVVFQFIALYDLFRSCEPKNATAYLIISIFFSVAMPFLVFAQRNKDEGMISQAEQQRRWQEEQARYQQWQAQQWQAQQAWQAQQWQAQQAWQQQQQWQAQQAWQQQQQWQQPQQPQQPDPKSQEQSG